ncbi:MAG: plastocyanin/azurin family copper-binding protein [Bacteroidota bacterium]
MRIPSVCVALALLVLTGCSGGGAADVLIQPVGNTIAYEQTAFTVSAGQTVNLTFENLATMEVMRHNVIILNTDDAAVADRVGTAGMMAADSDYIPEDDAILAYTAMAGPGETKTVTFTAPTEPGSYMYICTYPGHSTLMRGIMTVQ